MGRNLNDLKPTAADFILVVTTDEGPWKEDSHFVILAGEDAWEIPNSQAAIVFDWFNGCDRLDWEQSILAATCVENRIFVLWQKEGPPVQSEVTLKELESRLVSLLTRNFSAGREKVQEIAARILSHYREPHRKYHNLRHIAHCLWELDQLGDSDLNGARRDVIELAIWYHDVIYQPKSKTNEEESAAKLLSDLQAFEPQLPLAKVHAMILASKHAGANAAQDPETDLFLDIDLAILGRPELEYKVYQQNVRDEYAEIPTWKFLMGRKKVLKHFLNLTLYRTAVFSAKYEVLGKENLKAELKQAKYRWIPF